MPCPARVPKDLVVGNRVAFWFGPPFDKWCIGKITEINKRKTTSDNVKVQFEDGPVNLLVSTETYGVEKEWVLLGEQIQIID